LIDFISNVFTGDWDAAWKNIKDIFKGIWDTIKKIFTDTWNNIKDFYVDRFKAIKDTFTDAFNGIKDFLGELWDNIKIKIYGTWNSIFETLKTTLGLIKDIFITVFGKIKKTVTDIFQGMWDGIKGIINSLISGVEGMANGVVKAINTVINAINGLKVDVPDWVTAMTGVKDFGFNIPTIPNVSIPRLAEGGYVKANTPQLAMIGDNRTKGEVVAPEDKMLQMALTAAKLASNGGNTELLQIMIKLLTDIYTAITGLKLESTVAGRDLKTLLENETNRAGYQFG
jgi:phage-related protein